MRYLVLLCAVEQESEIISVCQEYSYVGAFLQSQDLLLVYVFSFPHFRLVHEHNVDSGPICISYFAVLALRLDPFPLTFILLSRWNILALSVKFRLP